MISDVLNLSANSIWSQISVVVMLLCFVGILVWTLRGRKNRFAHESTLPLDDGAISQTDESCSGNRSGDHHVK